MTSERTKPDWNRLFETSAAQAGYFSTRQAANAGFSTQLLRKHVLAGRVVRLQRGIYRLVHFPAEEHEELAVVWLWSEHRGVFSHQTALWLHELSDILPSQIDLMLPASWSERRFRVPEGIVLHHGDVAPEARAWFGPVPATNVPRTLNDCAVEGLSPEFLHQAAHQALQKGLARIDELDDVLSALEPFGGLAP